MPATSRRVRKLTNGDESAESNISKKPKRTPITINARIIQFGLYSKDKQGILMQQSSFEELHLLKSYGTVKRKKLILAIEDFNPEAKCNILLSCGDGAVGQLALGEDLADRCARPKKIQTFSPPLSDGVGFLQIAAGSFHTVVLTSNSKVYTCGCNDDCALGRECLEDDGQKKRLEDQDFILRPITFSDELSAEHGRPIQISAGDSHTAFLTSKGSVFAWGTFRDKQGCLGLFIKHNPKDHRAQTQIVEKSVTPLLISSFREHVAVKICSGFNHLAFLTCDGKIFTLGAGDCGQLGRLGPQFRDSRTSVRTITRMLIPAPIVPEVRHSTFFKDVWCTGYCCFAKAEDDTIYVWGLNNYYQLGYVPNDPEQIDLHFPVKSEHFESSVKWTNFSGDHHIVATDDQKNVYTIGRGHDFRLGNSSNENAQVLQKLSDLDGVVAGVAAGNNYSYAWNNDGSVLSWGYDLEGETGQGLEDSGSIETPRVVQANTLKNVRIVQIAAGGQHALFMGILMADKIDKQANTHDKDA
uniref:Regulator of chromosome condensation n=1 Tax=Romanomermis culicivorax TaxID=13658 RepID=A0A915IBS4_ROMCU